MLRGSTIPDAETPSILDEEEDQWEWVVDVGNGNVAVEFPGNKDCPRTAGVFTFDPRSKTEGTISPCSEWSHFGVNCTEELVVHDGRWQGAVEPPVR